MRRILTTAMLALALATGCSSGGAKREPTQKQAAIAQWNAARASVLLTLANDQFKTGNFDKARQTLAEVSRLAPENASLWILSGKLNIELSQLEQAERDLQRAVGLAPAAAEPHYLLGVIYQRWQKLPEALNEYQAAADKQPAELAYTLARAETLVAMDRSKDALAILLERLPYFENNPVIRDAAGQLLVQQKRYNEAVEMFRQATMLAPDDPGLKERFARALFAAQKYRDSADVLSRLVRDERNAQRADLYVMLGEACSMADRPGDARSAFETATQINPSSVAAWQGIAKSALMLNDIRRAELAVRKALAIDGGDSQSQLLLGYLLLRQGKPAESLVAFRKAAALDQTDAVSLCMCGYVLERMGQTEAAIEMYAKALKLKPGDELATQLMAGIGANE